MELVTSEGQKASPSVGLHLVEIFCAVHPGSLKAEVVQDRLAAIILMTVLADIFTVCLPRGKREM